MALYEQNRQQGDNVSEPQQEDVALEAINKKVDENSIDKIVNMIHNNFNRYIEVSNMVFAKNLSAEARKLLDNHIGQDNVIDNPDKTKLLKSLYETWSNYNDREKIGDLLPTMIIYARRFFYEQYEAGQRRSSVDINTGRDFGRKTDSLHEPIPRKIQRRSIEIRRAIRSSVTPSAIEAFLKSVDDMDTFDKKSVFSFANEKVNGKAKYSVSLKETQHDKISEYREGQLDKIAKGKNGRRVGNSFKYVFDDINDRNAFLEKAADYIQTGEKATLREQDIYNRQHSANMQGASFNADLDKLPNNKQTITEKMLSDFCYKLF